MRSFESTATTQAAPDQSPPPQGAHGASVISRLLALIFVLFISFGLPFIPLPEWCGELIRLIAHAHRVRLALYLAAPIIVLVFIAVATLLIVKLWERETLSSVGVFAPKLSDLLFGICAFILVEHIWTLLYAVLAHLGAAHGGGAVSTLNPLRGLPLIAYQTSLEVLSAVTEEITDRGYTIERLSVWLRSRSVAAFCSFVLSEVAHIPDWGIEHLIYIAPGELTAVLLYVAIGRIAPCIVEHALADVYNGPLGAFIPISLQYYIEGQYLIRLPQ